MIYLLVLLLVLLVIVYQDFKYRAISWWTIPILLGSSLWYALSSSSFRWAMLLVNNSLLMVQLLGVMLYFSIKHRQLVNLTKQYLGIGDILFLVAISPIFAPLHFCLFLVFGLLLTLIIWGLCSIFSSHTSTIPLAGFLSVYLLLILLLVHYTAYALHQDWILFRLIYG